MVVIGAVDGSGVVFVLVDVILTFEVDGVGTEACEDESAVMRPVLVIDVFGLVPSASGGSEGGKVTLVWTVVRSYV